MLDYRSFWAREKQKQTLSHSPEIPRMTQVLWDPQHLDLYEKTLIVLLGSAWDETLLLGSVPPSLHGGHRLLLQVWALNLFPPGLTGTSRVSKLRE